MKTFYLSFFFLNFLTTILSQNNYDWIHSIGNNSGDVKIHQICGDSENGVVMVGTYNSPNLSLPGITDLSNNGTKDIFLAKMDTSGNIVWAKSIGGENEDNIGSIVVDTSGNIVLAGNTKSNSITINHDVFNNSWPYTVFVTKLDESGNLLWFKKSTGATFNMQLKSCDVDKLGNVYFAGTYYNTFSFDGEELVNPLDLILGFMAKLDLNGNVQWIRSTSDSKNYSPAGIKVDESGQKVYVTGKYTKYQPVMEEFMFVSNYNTDSVFQWVYHDTLSLEGTDIEIDSKGDLIVLGRTYNYEMGLCNSNAQPDNTFNILVVNNQGDLLRRFDYVGAFGNDIFVDKNDTIMVIGEFFANNFQMGDSTLNRIADSSNSCAYYPDIFIVKMNSSGDVHELLQINGQLDDIGKSITKSGDNIYMAGTYESFHLNFGSEQIVNDNDLSVFNHVSGTYYDRYPFSFITNIKSSSGGGGGTEIINKSNKQLHLFPNPASDNLIIDFNCQNNQERYINIYSLTGAKLLQFEYLNKKIYDVSSLNNGIYILELTHGNEVMITKLIISR